MQLFRCHRRQPTCRDVLQPLDLSCSATCEGRLIAPNQVRCVMCRDGLGLGARQGLHLSSSSRHYITHVNARYPCRVNLPHDPLWPRAASIFSHPTEPGSDLPLVGLRANQNSISPTSPHLTPAAIRQALLRYSLAHSDSKVDLSRLKLSD